MEESLFPRRQPCPCGSGKKFKNCCEPDAPTIDPQRLMAAEARDPGLISRITGALETEIEKRKGDH